MKEQFFSTIINKPFYYETHNLLEMSNKIIEQEKLTFLDIISGCYAIENLRLEYDKPNFTFIRENVSLDKYSFLDKFNGKTIFSKEELCEIINLILVHFENFYEKICIESFKEYIDTYEKLKNDFEMAKIDGSNLTFEEFFATETKKRKHFVSIDFMDKVSALNRIVTDYFRISSILKNRISDYFFIVNEFLKEIGFKNVMINTFFETINRLPYLYDYRANRISYSGYQYTIHEMGTPFEPSTNFLMNSHILFKSMNKKGFNLNYSIIYNFNEEESKCLIDNAIKKAITKIYPMNEMDYCHQLEVMPIILNIDTKTNKIQLIDGYKRLFCMQNKTIMDRNCVFKVFYDLNDIDFLKMLYMVNYWKQSMDPRNNAQLLFHDRGYMFALKQRFGIEMETYSDNYKLLHTLQSYDSIQNKAKVMSFDLLPWSIQGYDKDFCCFVSDISQIKDVYEYENNSTNFGGLIPRFLYFYVWEILGRYRRQKEQIQKEICLKDLFNSIWNDKKLVKLFAKKSNLSTDTYVHNMFIDKNIKYDILEKIKNMNKGEKL